jgi:hypothetical protein
MGVCACSRTRGGINLRNLYRVNRANQQKKNVESGGAGTVRGFFVARAIVAKGW